jgi:hypothetical protein
MEHSQKVLSADSLKAMTTAGQGDYGLGVMVAKRGALTVIEHGGGIEGFNTNLMYVPDRRIAVVVLANVNGGAPATMGDQLLDVVLGNPVTLASEKKAVPIAREELAKFVGVFDLAPTFSVTFAIADDVLTAQGTGQGALPVIHLSIVGGHPHFFNAQFNAEFEFVPDASGAFTSMVLHQGGHEMPGKRH